LWHCKALNFLKSDASDPVRRVFCVLERVAFNQKQKASKGAFERKREAVPFEFN
jgi:hypothetical protein